MKKLEFYICKHCKNVVVKLHDSKVPVVCCGENMGILEPGVVDAATEKHVPKCDLDGNTLTVQVGDVIHPMSEEHLIEFVVVETNKRFGVHYFKPNDEPITKFTVDETPIAVYEYCNLHGLWKKEL